MFDMINKCFQLRDVFEALCNMEEFKELNQLSNTNWEVLKSMINFLAEAKEYTVVSSGRRYHTLSMQSMVYQALEMLCQKTISDETETGFATPMVKKAAAAMQQKLLKYYHHLNSTMARIALVLDPRTSNAGIDDALKDCIRLELSTSYGYSYEEQMKVPIRKKSKLFSIIGQHQQQREDITGDELHEYLRFTQEYDELCDDIIEWWKTIGRNRFPFLSKLAKDILMVMGSSVPPV